MQLMYFRHIISVCQNCCPDTCVLASSSESFLPTSAFIYIWWITLPNFWVCYGILYGLFFFSLSRSLLHCLDQLFAFIFSVLISQYLLPLSLIVTVQIVSVHNTHTDLLILFACLFSCLHICILYFYCLAAFTSVPVFSRTGTASVGTAHFSCRMNLVVFFGRWVGQ